MCKLGVALGMGVLHPWGTVEENLPQAFSWCFSPSLSNTLSLKRGGCSRRINCVLLESVGARQCATRLQVAHKIKHSQVFVDGEHHAMLEEKQIQPQLDGENKPLLASLLVAVQHQVARLALVKFLC